MSEQFDDLQFTPEQELESLKSKANLLGLKFHPSISADKLREKISAHLAGEAEPEQEAPKKENAVLAERAALRAEALKLVRVNITPMDPSKREYNGDIFSVSNSVFSVKRMVPYNTTDGTHVEKAIIDNLKEKKVQVFTKKKVNGKEVKEGKLISAYGIEYLDPLTKGELADLARRQAMANGTTED